MHSNKPRFILKSELMCIVSSLQYPLLPPVMTITCSRGLSDAHISSIHSDVQLMAEEKVGGPMLFDLLEVSDFTIRVF